jgi:hypothetical protein
MSHPERPAVDPRGSTEQALRAWRRGDALARGSRRATVRAGYARAVYAVMPALAHHRSVAGLVDAYERSAAEATDRAEEACRALPEGDFLVRSLVVDAAFWWRLRALVAAATRAPTGQAS